MNTHSRADFPANQRPNQRPDQHPWPHHHPQPDDPSFDDWYDSLDQETRAIFDAPPEIERTEQQAKRQRAELLDLLRTCELFIRHASPSTRDELDTYLRSHGDNGGPGFFIEQLQFAQYRLQLHDAKHESDQD